MHGTGSACRLAAKDEPHLGEHGLGRWRPGMTGGRQAGRWGQALGDPLRQAAGVKCDSVARIGGVREPPLASFTEPRHGTDQSARSSSSVEHPGGVLTRPESRPASWLSDPPPHESIILELNQNSDPIA